jgi:flavin-binding protein dodecin
MIFRAARGGSGGCTTSRVCKVQDDPSSSGASGRPASWPRPHASQEEDAMTVARVTEITSTSPNGFEDAIEQGIARATRTLRNVRSAWIKEQRVDIDGDRIAEYQVNMLVTFVLDEGDPENAG